jgi:hypothetical protein
MERTEAQREASRLNGAKSRGPVTEEGKAAASQNARKCEDVESRVALAIGEDPDGLERCRRVAFLEIQARDEAEEEIAERIARSRWRIHQCDKLVTDYFNKKSENEPDQTENFIRYSREFAKLSTMIAREERRVRHEWMLIKDRRRANKPKPVKKSENAIKTQNEPKPAFDAQRPQTADRKPQTYPPDSKPQTPDSTPNEPKTSYASDSPQPQTA